MKVNPVNTFFNYLLPEYFFVTKYSKTEQVNFHFQYAYIYKNFMGSKY